MIESFDVMRVYRIDTPSRYSLIHSADPIADIVCEAVLLAGHARDSSHDNHDSGGAVISGPRQASAVVQAADSCVALVLAGCSMALPYRHMPMHSALVSWSGVNLGAASLFSAATFALIWIKCMSVFSLYDRGKRRVRQVCAQSAEATLLMTAVLGIYLARDHGPKQCAYISTAFFLSAFVYEVVRSGASGRIGELVTRPEAVIIVGTGRRAQKAWRELRVTHHKSARFLGFVDDCSFESLAPDLRQRYLGGLSSLPSYLMENAVDVLILATSLRCDFSMTRDAVAIAELFDLRVLCLEDNFELGINHAVPNSFPVFSELTVRKEGRSLGLLLMHGVDKVVAACLLTPLLPLLCVVCLVAKLLKCGSLLISEPCFGYHRKEFGLLSLRSSSPASANVANVSPMATGFGQLLHLTRLDHAPRLWNVLVGDMSLLGPRPLTTRGLSPIEDVEWSRMFRARPGLCQPWKVLSFLTRWTPEAAHLSGLTVGSGDDR